MTDILTLINTPINRQNQYKNPFNFKSKIMALVELKEYVFGWKRDDSLIITSDNPSSNLNPNSFIANEYRIKDIKQKCILDQYGIQGLFK